MSIVQWPHAVSTQRGKCVCLCNILILPTRIRMSITLMTLAQYVITKMLWRWNINIMDYEINKMSYLWLSLSLCIKVQNEKCIWKIFVKYTQICQSNTNTNTNISSGGFSNTNTNTNTDICVFKYKYKYKYVFDPSPGISPHDHEGLTCSAVNSSSSSKATSSKRTRFMLSNRSRRHFLNSGIKN